MENLSLMTIATRLDELLATTKVSTGYFKEAVDQAIARIKNEIDLKDTIHRRNVLIKRLKKEMSVSNV